MRPFSRLQRRPWADAMVRCLDLPLLIDASITEASLKGFCDKLGAQYAPWRAG